MEDDTTLGPIIRTKLNHPPVPVDHVHRPRLVEELERYRSRPLTLISAAAGYGKSTLASCWLATCECPGAWLSLDERDNDLRLFLTYFLEAIRIPFPSALQETLALVKARTLPAVSVLAASLLNELDRIEQAFILVLDDFHRIREPSVIDLLDEVLRYPPRSMHLVLACRRDPFLPISSLVARGLVTEICARDLCFTEEETATFLDRVLGYSVEEATAVSWTEKTEGWVTGLRMAAHSLRHQPDVAAKILEAPGNTSGVVGYLFDEVLAVQPPVFRRHLLRSSILDRFCAPLCDVLRASGVEAEAPEIDGQGFMTWLQENNLFLTPLDSENRWFRHHHIFQDLLRGQLKRECTPEEIAALHHGVSDWFAEKGLLEEATEHAVAGGDSLRAAQLVEQARLPLLNSIENWLSLSRLLGSLPDTIKAERAELLLAQAWVIFHHGKLEAIPPILDQVESLLSNDAGEQSLYGEVDFFRGYMLAWQNEGARSLKHLEDALERVPVTHYLIRDTAEMMVGLATQLVGEKERALQRLTDLIYSQPSPNPIRKWGLLVSLSYIHMISGELAEAFTEIRELTDLAINTGNVFAKAHSSYLLGLIHLYRNELDAAIPYLSQAAEHRYTLISVMAVDAMAALTYAYQALDMPDKSNATLALLFEYVRDLDDPACSTLARSCKARLSIMQGKPQSAYRLLRKGSPPPGFMGFFTEIPAITHCRGLLAEGSGASLREVEKRLQEYVQVSQAAHNTCQMIGIMVLLALTYQKQGRGDESLSVLDRALILARPGGFMRPFLEPGAPMVDLLKRLKKETEDTSFIDQILAAFKEKEDEGRVAAEGSDAQVPPPPAERVQPLIEPLTNRESEILERLGQRLQNKEIAEQLFISSETVKGHVKNIYQKLQVGNRREAVTRATGLGILASR